MLLHCDLVYAADDAKLSLPFVNLGLCPEAASSYLLPLVAGYQRAAELLLFGEPFSAEKAREAGIVTAVVPREMLMDTAMAAARKLAERPPAALRITKQLMKRVMKAEIEEALAEEFDHFGARLDSPEAKEAMTAFFEKRKPDFSRFG
jgi:enoyl-CoA hydratase/carnithine racemase